MSETAEVRATAARLVRAWADRRRVFEETLPGCKYPRPFGQKDRPALSKAERRLFEDCADDIERGRWRRNLDQPQRSEEDRARVEARVAEAVLEDEHLRGEHREARRACSRCRNRRENSPPKDLYSFRDFR